MSALEASSVHEGSIEVRLVNHSLMDFRSDGGAWCRWIGFAVLFGWTVVHHRDPALFHFSSPFLDTSVEFPDNLFSVYHLYDHCRITLLLHAHNYKLKASGTSSASRCIAPSHSKSRKQSADKGSNKRETDKRQHDKRG